jgi:hypothetical protein
MSRKILIASANPWAFSLAVERDIARINGGCTVDALNLFKLATRVSPHVSPRQRLYETLDRTIERFVLPAINGRDITAEIEVDETRIPPVPEDVRGLRSYRLGGAGIGLGVLSSITSMTTIQEPRSTSEYGRVFEPAWRSAHLAYLIGEEIAPMGYEEVYIFNGRHCYSRPFIDVMERCATVFRYEQGSSGNSYVMSAESIHHPNGVRKLIAGHDFSREDGERFYLDRLKKAPGDPVNFFTSAQIEGHLPEPLRGRRLVSFFTSSSDEMFAITDDLGFGRFPTQFAAAMAMARAAASIDALLVVRFHPHLQYKHDSWRREWDFDALRAAGAFLIGPGDPCDSYALAGSSHCVFTCGSTVGFECSFLGIPNADVGPWLGGIMGATGLVLDEADVAAFIADPRLPEGAREGALRYGSYVRRAGKPLPELDVGRHPYEARIGGRIVSRSRYALLKLRRFARRAGLTGGDPKALGITAGKVILDPNLKLGNSKETATREPAPQRPL